MGIVTRFKDALLSIDRVKARDILLEVTQAGPDAKVTLEELIYRSMCDIGEGWDSDTVTLAQVYMSGRICETLIQEIIPEDKTKAESQSRMAVAVLDDYHLLGKRIVKSILVANGFHLLDYGTATVEKLVEKVKRDRVQILLISVLMLPSALRVKELRTALADLDLHPYIIVGGAPFRFDADLYREVGADATGNRAADAIGLINGYLAEQAT